jgi:hypothetical protein
MGFPALTAPVFQVGSFCWLITAGDLRELPVVPYPRVSFSLAVNPLEAGFTATSYFFNFMLVVSITVRTISIEPTRHLHIMCTEWVRE